jgi:hypothetical protein
MANQTTTNFDDFLDTISFEVDGEEGVEAAYALHANIREREGGEMPFEVTAVGDQTFVKYGRSPNALTLRLASAKALDTFCQMFERRFLDGDAESHIGFMRAMANPKA